MEPLTIEELKSLKVGDWVWIVETEDGISFYARHDEEYCVTMYPKTHCDEFAYTSADEFGAYDFAYYGTKWLAYKNKEQAEAKNSRIISDEEFWELSNRYTQKELDERIEFAKKKAVEELKAKGEIVELPCKVGDTVYRWLYGNYDEFSVSKICLYRSRNEIDYSLCAENESYLGEIFHKNDEGYDWFLTKSEAERRLAELKGEKE